MDVEIQWRLLIIVGIPNIFKISRLYDSSHWYEICTIPMTLFLLPYDEDNIKESRNSSRNFPQLMSYKVFTEADYLSLWYIIITNNYLKPDYLRSRLDANPT